MLHRVIKTRDWKQTGNVPCQINKTVGAQRSKKGKTMRRRARGRKARRARGRGGGGRAGDERLARGETLKPVHVKTRIPDLPRGRRQAKQRGGEPKRDTQAFKLHRGANVLVYDPTSRPKAVSFSAAVALDTTVAHSKQ